ncbi:MAG: hypothetical protein ACUVR8_02185 [Acidobacteriota bacterium]
MLFPTLDPIPLPAPVWLFKVLHIVTLALHFITIYLMVGGLTLTALWNFRSRNDASSPLYGASADLAHRLPVVMTYLVNLGIPPLLFAQVLYGRALYTSSILIGVYWLAVIFMLTAAYYLLYVAARWADQQRSFWWLSLLSLVGVTYIGRIYATNLTLMLRPEVWLELYRTDPLGAQLPTDDPTTLPRFFFMMLTSFAVTGAALLVLAQFGKVEIAVRAFIHRWGSWLAGLGGLLAMGMGAWVYATQPAVVKAALSNHPLYRWSLPGFLACAALLALLGFLSLKMTGWLPAIGSAIAGVLATAMAVIARDGIRDLTLLAKGFDVWQQPVASNWQVIVLFLLLFVAGLGTIGWMIYVLAQAKGVTRHA